MIPKTTLHKLTTASRNANSMNSMRQKQGNMYRLALKEDILTANIKVNLTALICNHNRIKRECSKILMQITGKFQYSL
jgi:hypothetical protein